MKILITGASGAVGSAVSDFFEKRGDEVICWNRTEVPIDNYHEMEKFVADVQPDALYHLAVASQPTGRDNESWLVTYEWTSELAWITRILEIPFVFSSTVMVYSDQARGPFTLDVVADANEGYGHEKLQAETRIFYQNPDAYVVRLGWQIGATIGSNNMIDYLDRQTKEHGQVTASRGWFPACSFLEDTAAGLAGVIEKEPGLYLFDANKKWTFFEIASALNDLHGNPWKIIATEDYVYDQRMIDGRMPIPSLKERLSDLP